MDDNGFVWRRRFRRTVACLLLASASPMVGSASAAEITAPQHSNWGVDPIRSVESLSISAASFRPRAYDVAWDKDSEGWLWATASADAVPLWAPVILPSGALIAEIRLLYRTAGAGQMTASLLRRSGTTNPITTTVGAVSSGAGTGISVADLRSLPAADRTIDNLGAQYSIELTVGSLGPGNAIRGVMIDWHRQVSPSPVFARFTDVPTTSAQFPFIEALQMAGITGGCTASEYCPDDPITRGQMAVFLTLSLGLFWAP